METAAAPTPHAAAHNLFFAIRPPADICRRIALATASLPIGGKPMRADRLHITILQLVHAGPIPDGIIAEASEVAAGLDAPAFNVMFDQLVGGSASILLQPSEPLDALRMFREQLGFMLRTAGVDFRFSGPFRPHVTLLYGNEVTFEAEIDPVIWKVEEFMLIDSLIGQTKHVELGRWRLGR